jgi:type IV secretory pathway VirJ component
MSLLRLLAVPALMLLLAMAAAQAAPERRLDAGILGSLPVIVPDGEPRGLVFLFSDREGWTDDLQRAAERLSTLGAVVLEVDLPAYLDRLRRSDDSDCHYLISAIEAASKRLQRELGATRYLSPILAGTGMGSALAYGALAQAPAATIAGAASDGLVTGLAMRLPLCPGALATATGAGFDYGPASELPGWWRIAVSPQQKAAAQRFVAGMPETELIEVPDGAGLDERLAALLADPLGRTAQDSSSVKGLPLVELPASGEGDLLAVFYSGDGGWRDLDKEIGGILAAHGIATVGVDSLRYFWSQKTPQQVADDLATILRHYREFCERNQVILLGYSFGAGILPFAVNRLPPAERARIRQISLLGLEKKAPFQFHLTEWLGVGGSSDARPVLPEAAKLDPALVQCFYGEEEEDTACRAPEFDRAERIETTGGHHFDGDYAALAEKIMAGARRRARP